MIYLSTYWSIHIYSSLLYFSLYVCIDMITVRVLIKYAIYGILINTITCTFLYITNPGIVFNLIICQTERITILSSHTLHELSHYCLGYASRSCRWWFHTRILRWNITKEYHGVDGLHNGCVDGSVDSSSFVLEKGTHLCFLTEWSKMLCLYHTQ